MEKKAAMALRPTSAATISKPNGFTLIEVIIVVAILGMIAVMVLPRVSNIFKVSLSSSSREIASASKQAYNAAVMTKRIYRLAIDLGKQQYWIEGGPTQLSLDTVTTRERQERARKFMDSDELKKLEEEETTRWQLAKTITRKKQSLATGVSFEGAENELSQTIQQTGVFYVHFFPQGIVEKAVIQLKDNANHFSTLYVEALVGRSRVYPQKMSLKEVTNPK